MANLRSSGPARVARRLVGRGWKRLVSGAVGEESLQQVPPVLANSFPKSGTHLLSQVVGALPHRRDLGEFLASVPSRPHRPVPKRVLVRRIGRLLPGETARGHLFHDEEFVRALSARHVTHFFIVRDPRDVIVSECHYLRTANRWHEMHGRFAECANLDEALELAIVGLPDGSGCYYPDLARRFAPYAAWLDCPSVTSVRFEELVGPERRAAIGRIVDGYFAGSERASTDAHRDVLVGRCEEAIRPGRSHTYREGRVGGWEETLSHRQKQLFKQVAGALLIELGYEQDLSW